MVQSHAVSGFSHGNALYCVVGSDPAGGFTLAELAPVVAKVKATLGVRAGCEPVAREAVASAAGR